MNKKVRNLNTTNKEIEKIVWNDVDTFIKMIQTNDVHEAELSNTENNLFRKLMEKSLSRDTSIEC